jgi:hypothetical protein
MTTRAQLEKAIADAEREVDAAKTLTAVKAGAKKLQRAKAELKELEAAEPKRKATRGGFLSGRRLIVCCLRRSRTLSSESGMGWTYRYRLE